MAVPSDWPEVPEDLVAYLEEAYQPRCMQPGEDPSEHHHYAGMVELVSILRAQADEQRVDADPAEDEEDGDPTVDLPI